MVSLGVVDADGSGDSDDTDVSLGSVDPLGSVLPLDLGGPGRLLGRDDARALLEVGDEHAHRGAGVLQRRAGAGRVPVLVLVGDRIELVVGVAVEPLQHAVLLGLGELQGLDRVRHDTALAGLTRTRAEGADGDHGEAGGHETAAAIHRAGRLTTPRRFAPRRQ